MPYPVRFLGTGALTLLAATLTVSAWAEAGPFEGYWKELDVEDPVYASYLKVEADSGYRCVMDGKSSFRFKIKGDSITTPMNGSNAIVLTSANRLRISGVEKGDAYHSDYAKMDASGYPRACIDEEEAWYGPTSLRGRLAEPIRHVRRGSSSGPAAFGFRGRFLDALGRIHRAH